MKRISLGDLEISKDVMALNKGVLGKQGGDTPGDDLKAGELEKFAGRECDLQAECESWLTAKGYGRRSNKVILGEMPERGWFVHMHRAPKNPILLDLLILNHAGEYLEIELKTKRGRVSDVQEVLIGQGEGCRAALVYSLDEFRCVVERWERWRADPGGRMFGTLEEYDAALVNE